MTRSRRILKIENEIERLIEFRNRAPIGTRRNIDRRIAKLRTLAMELANNSFSQERKAPSRTSLGTS